MQTAEGGNWKVLLPFQRTGKWKWDKREFKRREVSRGEKKGKWCHLENCKPINQWGIIPRAEKKWLKEPACRGAQGWQEAQNQEAGQYPCLGSADRGPRNGSHSLLPPPPSAFFFFFYMNHIRRNTLYPKGLYRSSLMWTLGVSFSNSYLWVQLHRIFFITEISFIKARPWWFCQFLLLTDEIVLPL